MKTWLRFSSQPRFTGVNEFNSFDSWSAPLPSVPFFSHSLLTFVVLPPVREMENVRTQVGFVLPTPEHRILTFLVLGRIDLRPLILRVQVYCSDWEPQTEVWCSATGWRRTEHWAGGKISVGSALSRERRRPRGIAGNPISLLSFYGPGLPPCLARSQAEREAGGEGGLAISPFLAPRTSPSSFNDGFAGYSRAQREKGSEWEGKRCLSSPRPL